MTKNVIELNGQKYDAATGRLLTGAPAKPSHATAAPKHKPTAPSGVNMDGFSRRPATKRPTTAISTSKIHSQPAKSQTLMRTVVKKPAAPAKIHAKAHAAPAAKHKSAPAKVLAETVKPGRAIRATNIQQSNLISKFGAAAAAIKTEVLAVRPEPAHRTAHTPKAAPAKAPNIVNHPQQTIAEADPFQAALAQAVSHEQPKAKKPKLHHRVARKLHVSPKIVSMASFAVVALAIGGFVAYQNMPELAMRVAAARAGLHANLPAYQPSGYAMTGPIQYEPGEVKVNYKSNSDDRSFNVIQKNSSWNSETLLDNFVETTKKPYQTVQANGRTIYIYDGNKATWVDGGIWYSIDGQSNLNSDQLLRIAGSL